MGYQQDPRASEMTASQRAVQELQEAEAGSVNGVFATLRRGSGGIFDGTIGGNASGGPGVLHGPGDEGWEGRSKEVVGEAWKGARRFLGSVGEKLGEMEGEVWKRVGK